jgi:poly-gamma-glutamate capsule biosynthesis protein CapA/YwtB (metallophosphatase superfamily)
MSFFTCSQPEKSIHILFAGDMMLDRGTRRSIENNGIEHLFEHTRDVFSRQDIVLVNLEQPVCDPLPRVSDKKYYFRADPEWLPFIRQSGITHVSLANNHIGDFGRAGIEQTMLGLSRNSIMYIGADSAFQHPCQPLLIEQNGSKLALFSNTFLYQQQPAGCCNKNDAAFREQIADFRKEHPDFCIILCLHWGTEMQAMPAEDQQRQARTLIDAGADLIIGHHPHVVQPIELYKGKYICYSLGNFIFDTNKSLGNTGMFACFDISDNTITLAQVIPFKLSDSRPLMMNETDARQFLDNKQIGF